MGMLKSFNMHFSETALHATIVAPLYSTCVLDNATIGYFLLLQEIAPLPMEKTNLEVNRRSAL